MPIEQNNLLVRKNKKTFFSLATPPMQDLARKVEKPTLNPFTFAQQAQALETRLDALRKYPASYALRSLALRSSTGRSSHFAGFGVGVIAPQRRLTVR